MHISISVRLSVKACKSVFDYKYVIPQESVIPCLNWLLSVCVFEIKLVT